MHHNGRKSGKKAILWHRCYKKGGYYYERVSVTYRILKEETIMDKSYKVVFLDIDGVLNNKGTNKLTPEGFIGIDDGLLNKYARFIHETGAKTVLVSSWKDEWSRFTPDCKEDGIYLDRKFRQKGIFIKDKTDEREKGSFYRGYAIEQFLQKHPMISSFVILDDDEFDYADCPFLSRHIVHTDSYDGLTQENIIKAKKILNL